MPRILALDASTDACSVALTDGKAVQGRFELAAKSHTQRLLPLVDELLGQSECSLSSIDAIAFGCGPGSFTGLRICLGLVQGLAFSRKLPVISVSTLATMAAGYYRENPGTEEPVLTALDARMNEVYWAMFRPESDRVTPYTLIEEQIMPPEKVADEPELRALSWTGVGQGWHYPALRKLEPRRCIEAVYPAAEDVARLALEAFNRGEVISAQEAQPLYLRDTVSWKKRTRIRPR